MLLLIDLTVIQKFQIIEKLWKCLANSNTMTSQKIILRKKMKRNEENYRAITSRTFVCKSVAVGLAANLAGVSVMAIPVGKQKQIFNKLTPSMRNKFRNSRLQIEINGGRIEKNKTNCPTSAVGSSSPWERNCAPAARACTCPRRGCNCRLGRWASSHQSRLFYLMHIENLLNNFEYISQILKLENDLNKKIDASTFKK